MKIALSELGKLGLSSKFLSGVLKIIDVSIDTDDLVKFVSTETIKDIKLVIEKLKLSMEIKLDNTIRVYENGLLVYFESSHGSWAKWTYENGLLIYYEDSDGYWRKLKYENGLKTYFESSHGSWDKWEYENGLKTYYESSDGYWEKYTYENGLLVYSKDSNGCWIKY